MCKENEGTGRGCIVKTDLTRRGFFRLVAGAASLAVVPAPATALPIIYSDGIHCDSDGIEALTRGEPVEFLNADDASRIGWISDDVLGFGNATMHSWRTVFLRGFTCKKIKNLIVIYHTDVSHYLDIDLRDKGSNFTLESSRLHTFEYWKARRQLFFSVDRIDHFDGLTTISIGSEA